MVVIAGLACVSLGFGAADRVAADPVKLTTAQMDGVTAGAESISITATGTASGGEAPEAGAKSKTKTIITKKKTIMMGMGHAYATGDTHDVDFSSSYTTDGEVLVDMTKVHEVDNPNRSVGNIHTKVVSENP